MSLGAFVISAIICFQLLPMHGIEFRVSIINPVIYQVHYELMMQVHI
jgi:hypothetical protein